MASRRARADRITKPGVALEIRTQEAFAPDLRQEIDTWTAIIREVGLQPV
jgi:tripartite-type tricarboxylate transporter receptor subunit TctC